MRGHRPNRPTARRRRRSLSRGSIRAPETECVLAARGLGSSRTTSSSEASGGPAAFVRASPLVWQGAAGSRAHIRHCSSGWRYRRSARGIFNSNGTVRRARARTYEDRAPARQSQAPARQSQAPASQSQAPASQSQAPARQSQAPARQSQAPARQSQAPASQGQAPASQGQAPARQGQAPASQGQAPARQSQAPARQSQAPARQSQAPASQSQAPARQSQAPGGSALSPPNMPGAAPGTDSRVGGERHRRTAGPLLILRATGEPVGALGREAVARGSVDGRTALYLDAGSLFGGHGVNLVMRGRKVFDLGAGGLSPSPRRGRTRARSPPSPPAVTASRTDPRGTTAPACPGYPPCPPPRW